VRLGLGYNPGKRSRKKANVAPGKENRRPGKGPRRRGDLNKERIIQTKGLPVGKGERPGGKKRLVMNT